VKLGILGGSFNPVHVGHLFLADTVLSKLKLDRVILIPAYQSPFKLSAGIASSADDRLDMLSAAVAGDSRFAIDPCEIMREGVSYTVDTLEDIIARYMPEGKSRDGCRPKLIIGDDLVADFHKWQNSEKILQLADIVIARRIDPSADKIKKICDFPHTLIDNEVMNISSNMIRQLVAEEGESGEITGWRSLVQPGVRAIIEDRRLYGYKDRFSSKETYEDIADRTECSQSNIQRIETAARETLSTGRFLHSRNTALMASDMCRRFGLDPMAGYLAGIAHDLAKQIENKQLLKIVKNAEIKISPLEKDKPNILHGKAAAVLLRDRFFIHNKDVLEAVACHTSGSENMGPLAKVIYIADKTESSRNIDSELREMCLTFAGGESDLDIILFAVLERTIKKLQAKKLDLSDDTLRLYNKMKKGKG